MIKRLGKCIGNLLQLASIMHCILFQHKRSSFFALCWEAGPAESVLPPLLSGQPGLRTSGNSRSFPPVPCLCHEAKELLTVMDFSFVYLSESMLCFCLSGRGPRSNISFHNSSSSHFFFKLFPLCTALIGTTSPVAPVCLHFLFSSQSAHLCANPCYSYNGARLKLA